MGKGICGMIFTSTAALAILLSPASLLAAAKPATATAKEDVSKSWKDFNCSAGNCSLKFPATPEHVSESMKLPEEGYELRYDAYISAADKQSVYMLLVAQYPSFVDESYAHMSLEGFLNGILNHNPGNQLIFADLLLVDGHEALDFFIRTGSVYFKGRAMMVKNNLYLMAMECEMQSYDEGRYNTFVTSFKLTK